MKGYRCANILVTIALLGIGSCRTPRQPQPTPTPVASVPQLELDNLTFKQVNKQGQSLWKIRAQRGVYSPNRQSAKVTNLDGDLYQDGQIVLHITAKTGEIEQAGEKVFLRGDVITQEIRNKLILIGQEVEWQPKADLLIVRDRVQANQPKFQVNATEGRYFTRKQQMDLTGKISAVASDPRLAMQTTHLIWQVRERQVIGDRATQIQRYQGDKITATATANRFSTRLDRQIVNLQGKVQLNAVNPPIQVNGESFAWDLSREVVTADRPLTIVHQQQAVTFTANAGDLDLTASTATLSGNARGVATRNRANISADRLIWQIPSQQLIGTGNVVYQQVDPLIKFTGTRGVGKLQDRSIVISSDSKQQVETEFVPN